MELPFQFPINTMKRFVFFFWARVYKATPRRGRPRNGGELLKFCFFKSLFLRLFTKPLLLRGVCRVLLGRRRWSSFRLMDLVRTLPRPDKIFPTSLSYRKPPFIMAPKVLLTKSFPRSTLFSFRPTSSPTTVFLLFCVPFLLPNQN